MAHRWQPARPSPLSQSEPWTPETWEERADGRKAQNPKRRAMRGGISEASLKALRRLSREAPAVMTGADESDEFALPACIPRSSSSEDLAAEGLRIGAPTELFDVADWEAERLTDQWSRSTSFPAPKTASEDKNPRAMGPTRLLSFFNQKRGHKDADPVSTAQPETSSASDPAPSPAPVPKTRAIPTPVAPARPMSAAKRAPPSSTRTASSKQSQIAKPSLKPKASTESRRHVPLMVDPFAMSAASISAPEPQVKPLKTVPYSSLPKPSVRKTSPVGIKDSAAEQPNVKDESANMQDNKPSNDKSSNDKTEGTQESRSKEAIAAMEALAPKVDHLPDLKKIVEKILNRIQNESDPDKQDRLSTIATVLCDVYSSGLVAEAAATQAETSAKQAQIARDMAQLGMGRVNELIKGSWLDH
ncbi:MAG: hypothetical protein M1828_006702 [Chrysothrix sp. TS-e1954]|nr:MAG: hypothetical protein M1828_006702 [Chrysothrix sp. TS-e1954]